MSVNIIINELFANVMSEVQQYKLFATRVFNRQLDCSVTHITHARACLTCGAPHRAPATH